LSQQAISAPEQKERIDDKILADVAKNLKVSPDAIKNFNEDAAVNYINTLLRTVLITEPSVRLTVQ